MSMNYIGKFFSNFKEFYNEINTATLTGAIDVIVVEQPDGTFNCSPFHVRFGKLGVLRSREKVVDIEINGEPQDIHMKLGESGEAFFVEEFEADDDIDIPEHLATSPIPVSEFENIFSTGRRLSLDLTEQPKQDDLNEVNDYKKRRNTADNETNLSTKVRERDFIKRQIGLGNLDIRENSVEDITLPSKLTNSNTNNSNSNSETISNYDSPDQIKTDTISSNKIDEKDGSVQTKNDDISNSDTRGSKKKRRKTKKKNAPRKSSSVSQLTNFGSETSDKNESTTDAASLDSSNSSSDPELKELQKLDNTNNNNANTPRKIIDPDFHFFSDTELTTNPNDLRSDLPIQIEGVQSDSEFEVKGRKGDKNNNPQSWEWGGFPIVTPTNSPTDEKIVIKNDQSVISNMFSFMKRNRQEEGMYLSDLNALNPKDAAVYFTTSKNERDMDCESGNGPSLTQSPNSADGCKSIDSDFEDHVKGTKRYIGEISMSLCGWEQEPDSGRFDEHAITFSDFCNNPLLIENSNLVVSIHGKFYNWKVAAPIMACLMVFNRPLLQSNIDQLCSLHMPSSYENKTKQEPKSSWWNWRRSKSSRETTPIVEIANKSSIEEMTPINTNNNINNNVTAINYSLNDSNNTTQKIESSTNNDNKNDSSPSLPSSPTDKFKKTLRLSSKQIASLNLRNGMNEIEFSVTTAYQGTSRCTCHLYKWKWDDKIVISDIDGTITKSDVLGHILPIVGKDWAQSGVAQLFNKIKDNGYKLLYLSARAIGQARITREYLKSIKQGDLTMPDGPILLNPTSLITAFHREVIEKKPEQFKISCMSDIKALFPPDTEPFYAGYGNRINDVWAYRAVGIPIVRIFTINPKGELKHELTQTFQSSYLCMTTYVDQLFPTLIDAANDYSQFVYWRDPIQHFDNVMEEI